MSAVRRSATWILIVAVLAAAGYATARHKRDFYDFEVYRTAAVRALHAEPLYRAEDQHYQYKYWPAFAFVMAPFALLDPELGKILWYTISVALLAVFIGQSIRALPDRRLSARALTWWTLLFTAKFIVKELVNGQTNTLLGVLVILAVIAARERRAVAAGLLIGAAVFVKPYALLLVPWLTVSAGAGALAACLTTLTGGLLLPAVVYGWAGNVQLLTGWYHTVAGTTPENLMLAENISFATMWAKWIGIGPMASALALGTTLAALLLVLVVWAKRRGIAKPDYLEVSLLLLLVPLISPQGWDYVLILGTPAIVCLVDRFGASSSVWRVATGAGFALTSFTVFDIVGRRAYIQLMAASVVSVGAVVLAVSLARIRFRSLA